MVVFASPMPASARELYAWHARGGAFERLVVPWQRVRVIDRVGGIEDGARLCFRIAVGPLRIRWVAEHVDCLEGREFTDVQRHGPFARWRHRHRFLDPAGEGVEGGAMLRDEVDFRLPLEPLSRWLGGAFLRRDLQRMFAFRHERTRRDLHRHGSVRGRSLRVAVTGSSGMIGGALCAFLTTGGHEVIRLVRRPVRPRIDGTRESRWDPESGRIDAGALEGVDAVVHLAGAPVAAARWSPVVLRSIRESRVRGTEQIARALRDHPEGPRVLIAASGIGYYGDRARTVDESSPPGTGFLADTARAWEGATDAARAAGIRVVNLRIGTVLGASGGLVARLLPWYRAGLGGPMAGGGQPLSWISLDDVVGVIHRCLLDAGIEGPINAVAPDPMPQREFARELGRALHRPAVLPIPGWIVRSLAGRMGEALALGGAPVVSQRLGDLGFDHLDRTVAQALGFELGTRCLQPDTGDATEARGEETM